MTEMCYQISDGVTPPSCRLSTHTLSRKLNWPSFYCSAPNADRRVPVHPVRWPSRGRGFVPEPGAPTTHPQLRVAPHLSPAGLSHRTPPRPPDSELPPAKAPPGSQRGDLAPRRSPANACVSPRPGSQLAPPALAGQPPDGVARHSGAPPRKHSPNADGIAPRDAVPPFPTGSAVHPASAAAGGCRPSCAQTLRAVPARSGTDALSATGSAPHAPIAGTSLRLSLLFPAAIGSLIPPPLVA